MKSWATKMSRGVQSVVVEYDRDGGRGQKSFKGNGAARRFYAEMSAAGRNPKVVSAVR